MVRMALDARKSLKEPTEEEEGARRILRVVASPVLASRILSSFAVMTPLDSPRIPRGYKLQSGGEGRPR